MGTPVGSRSVGGSRLLGLAAVGVLTALLCAPFLRSIDWLGDEGLLLHGADRMLRGERLYLDFFEALPPGGFVLTAGWLAVTGVSLAAARVLAILVIIAIACVTYLACYRVSRSAAWSAIAVLAWVVMSQGEWTQVSHHWFTTLFSVVALWALLAWAEAPRRHPCLVIAAGLAGGAAAMVTSHRGALALLAGFAAFAGIRRHFGALSTYCMAALVVPSLLFIQVVAQGALGTAFDSVIVFAAKRYGGIQGVSYGAFAKAQNAYLGLVFPLAAFLAALHVVRNWRIAVGDQILRVSAAFGLAGFIGILVRPDTVHIAFALPLVLPLLLYCASRLELLTFRSVPLAILIAVAALLTIPFAFALPLVVPLLLYCASRLEFLTFRSVRPAILTAVAALVALVPGVAFLSEAYLALRSPALQTPRGSVRLTRDVGSEAAIRRIMDLPVGDAVFFYPYSPLLPFLTARVHPARVDIFVPNFTTPAQFQEACVSVLRTATWIVIDRNYTNAIWQAYFPAMSDPATPERIRFEHMLERAFILFARDGDFELRRAAGTDQATCGHINEMAGKGD